MSGRDKKELIESLQRSGYLRTPGVIKAFRDIPREEFIPSKYSDHAYADQPLPIGNNQTISAPHMVAIMTELLEPKTSDKVLEIGGGSGYQAAILSKLVNKVYTIELDPGLAEFARTNLRKTGCSNVEVIHGDGSKGYKESPYDKIIVTCATPRIYDVWKEQLKDGGTIIAPVGEKAPQILIKGTKEKTFNTKKILDCVFVPLRSTSQNP